MPKSATKVASSKPLPPKPPLPKGDVVCIHSGIHYVRHGDITVNLTLVSSFGGASSRTDVTRSFAQPKTWGTDDAVVSGVQKLYPKAAVVWADDYAQ
jgi:hypothetical protein